MQWAMGHLMGSGNESECVPSLRLAMNGGNATRQWNRANELGKCFCGESVNCWEGGMKGREGAPSFHVTHTLCHPSTYVGHLPYAYPAPSSSSQRATRYNPNPCTKLVRW